jgi:hypothetical protein
MSPVCPWISAVKNVSLLAKAPLLSGREISSFGEPSGGLSVVPIIALDDGDRGRSGEPGVCGPLPSDASNPLRNTFRKGGQRPKFNPRAAASSNRGMQITRSEAG